MLVDYVFSNFKSGPYFGGQGRVVEGAKRLYQNGCRLEIPASVTKATEAYRKEESVVNGFVEECCEEGRRVGGRELYLAYKEWATGSEDCIRKESDFVRAMEAEGYRRMTSNGRKYWVDIKLSDEVEGGRP